MLDDVLQFADVAGPVVRQQQRHGLRTDAAHRSSLSQVVPLHEALGQSRNVFLAPAQRRQLQPDDVDAVKEVLTELALLDQRRQVAVGRGEDARTGLERLGAAQRLVGALLQDAQQLDLQGGRKVANLVE